MNDTKQHTRKPSDGNVPGGGGGGGSNIQDDDVYALPLYIDTWSDNRVIYNRVMRNMTQIRALQQQCEQICIDEFDKLVRERKPDQPIIDWRTPRPEYLIALNNAKVLQDQNITVVPAAVQNIIICACLMFIYNLRESIVIINISLNSYHMRCM